MQYELIKIKIMIWYKPQYDGSIKEIEVEKETDKFIFVKKFKGDGFDRILKRGQFANYFKTKKEAIEFVLKRAEDKKTNLENSLKAVNNFIEKFKKENSIQ